MPSSRRAELSPPVSRGGWPPGVDEEAQEQGNLVVTLGDRARRGSGSVLDMRIGQMWTFRDGKVIRYQTFPTWEQALESAGLRE